MDTQQIPQGTGSGFVWDTKGHIVTNFHVIRGASNIKVALIDSSVYPAKVWRCPLASIKIGVLSWAPCYEYLHLRSVPM